MGGSSTRRLAGIAVALVARARRRRPPTVTGARRRNAAVLVVAMIGCGQGPPPGEGAKAERGYRRAAPVIAALARFAERTGRYPDSLPQLVPDYLPAAALAVPNRPQEDYPLGYLANDSSYALTFRYVGPGINECTFRPGRGWECSGAL